MALGELDTVVHVLEMLISLLFTETESGVKEEPTPIANLVDTARDYYTSEASLRPPPEPTVSSTGLPIVLFQNLTSATGLEGLKMRLGHRQRLEILQMVIKRIKGTEVDRIVDWGRESFLKWVDTILQVRSRSTCGRHSFTLNWNQTEDKYTLLLVTEIVAELDGFEMLRPALHLADTSVPKEIQMTVSHWKEAGGQAYGYWRE